jgi:hypothetical protein
LLKKLTLVLGVAGLFAGAIVVAVAGPSSRSTSAPSVRPPAASLSEAPPRAQAAMDRSGMAPGQAQADTTAADQSKGDAELPVPSSSTMAFSRNVPPVSIQDASVTLTRVAHDRRDFRAIALKSTDGTAAVILVERSVHQRWGRLLIPAERRVFGAFAKNSKLGDWLILMTDYQIYGEADPVPITVYRWNRSDVEAYAACGIQPTGFDHCTDDFFRSADMIILSFGFSSAPH